MLSLWDRSGPCGGAECTTAGWLCSEAERGHYFGSGSRLTPTPCLTCATLASSRRGHGWPAGHAVPLRGSPPPYFQRHGATLRVWYGAPMKRALVPLAFVSAALAGYALAGGTYQTPTTVPTSCVSTTTTCLSGTCTGNVPDAGSAVGLLLTNVQGYTVRVCSPSNGQPLGGSGTIKDYHCLMDNGVCLEVAANAQTVSGTGRCWEAPSFVIPYIDNTSDRMVWVASAVSVPGADGGTLTVTVCPQL